MWIYIYPKQIHIHTYIHSLLGVWLAPGKQYFLKESSNKSLSGWLFIQKPIFLFNFSLLAYLYDVKSINIYKSVLSEYEDSISLHQIQIPNPVLLFQRYQDIDICTENAHCCRSTTIFPFHAAETNSHFQLVLRGTFQRRNQPLPVLLFLTTLPLLHVILTYCLRTKKKNPDHSIQLWMSAVPAEVLRSTCHEGA